MSALSGSGVEAPVTATPDRFGEVSAEPQRFPPRHRTAPQVAADAEAGGTKRWPWRVASSSWRVPAATSAEVRGAAPISSLATGPDGRTYDAPDLGTVSGRPQTGSPDDTHAWKPPMTSVARGSPSRCKVAAARLDEYPSLQMTITV
jgi:hypothetical protein